MFSDSALHFLESGKLTFASAIGLSLSKEGFARFYKNMPDYRERIILRPQQISNSPEIIRRLGVIAMNTALEVDLYGHVNSSHVNGSRIVNGIAGSGDFLRNSFISIVELPSIRKTQFGGWISTIVPMCPHVDHTEHDIDVIVTEQGLADLRGLTPVQRAREILKVVHPMFKDQLTAYLDDSDQACMTQEAMHEPHQLRKAFAMHINMMEKGTMVLDHW